MSLLWRTHGRHRDLAAERSAPRTAVPVPTIRDDAVVTRRDQHLTRVEAKLLRHTISRTLTPNSKRPDQWTLPQQAADDPSAHDKSSTSTSPLCPQRMHDTSKILKTP